jgi:hypothetical protein
MEPKCAALEGIVSKPEPAAMVQQPDAEHPAVDATARTVQ